MPLIHVCKSNSMAHLKFPHHHKLLMKKTFQSQFRSSKRRCTIFSNLLSTCFKLGKQRFDSLEIALLLDHNIKNHSYISVRFHKNLYGSHSPVTSYLDSAVTEKEKHMGWPPSYIPSCSIKSPFLLVLNLIVDVN